MTVEQKAEKYANNLLKDVTCNIGHPRPRQINSIDIEDAWLYGYKEGFKDCAKSRLNVTTISDCPIKDEWHYVKDGDLPKDTTSLYLVRVYSWDFGLSHLYKKYGMYIPTVCEWNGEYFKALDRDAYTNTRNINSCIAWKEIVLPEFPKEGE